MLNNSIRIRTTPDGKDKYVKVKLDQEFDFIEVLSLKITQAEAYRNFCADYGVVVGRVFINNGFGIPNARVSIFIPIDNIDKDDPIINGLYPYEIVTDKDIDGKRYNLLPKNSETDNECYTPVGTFPNKREVLDDPEMGHVYCKYYKFTTSTNYAGDYMIFGAPIGNYTVHVDADISDIGIASQRPYDSISQGTPVQMFDSPTKFKDNTNLDRLVQVKTTNAGINIQPFWGSVENCEIGISRIDLDLNYEIKPSAIFMGGLFGDTDNNSVNKNCRPRRKMGKICEQNTSEGTIEMIRETLNGNIEKLDIEGGRLIDENGAWAYQIPMNLDYYYTNEFGELVLSEDPNKGIPTRASVRFKIAMDGTGGEGRLRTRANYLVPHNPNNVDEIDYEFSELTKDFSFRDLYWNKIYSVTNFISRYQKSSALLTSPVNNRNFVGLKDVDDCVGGKTPAPFNRVNTVFNPLFTIICLIMKIIEFLIWIINIIVIPILNVIMTLINAVKRTICGILRKLRRILGYIGLGRAVPKFPFCKDPDVYVPCVGSFCPDKTDEDSKLYAPGCSGDLNVRGREQLELSTRRPIFTTKIGALSDCVAFQMAKLLNLFQFDFYNDWLNGSLYYYLVKYKKRRRREKYCNYDCSGNNCESSILIDSCYSDEKDSESIGISEGLIKKYNKELYYAPIKKNGLSKLYATEIVNLGSVFKCDWQGVPKIQEFLVPTTYIIPPTTDILLDNSTTVDTSGQVEIGTVSEGVFFKIDCIGIKLNRRQTLNIRHACEFGVDLDEIDFEDNGTQISANHIIGVQEINSQYGKYARDTFFGLNNVTDNINVTFPYSTDFNLCNVAEYDFSSDSTNNIYDNSPCTLQQNGSDYVNFRGYLNNTSFSQPKHSFYFYFGTIPGAGGLEKMNSKFFTRCFPELTVEFFIRIDDTTAISEDGALDGAVTFTIISGVGPFSYIVSGPNGYNISDSIEESNTPITLNGLGEGVYTINVTDSSGVIISQTFEIPPQIALYASASVTNINSALAPPYNGEITLFSVGGGNGTYNATLYNSSGVIVTVVTCNANSANGNPTTVTQLPVTFCGLPPDNAPNINPQLSGFTGYYIVVEDTSSPPQTFPIYNLVLNGLTGLSAIVTTLNPVCYDSKNGKITITPTGGVEPYEYQITLLEPAQNFSSPNITTAPIGQYTIVVTDSGSPSQTTPPIPVELKSEFPQMKLIRPAQEVLANQCDPTQYKIKLKIQNGGSDFNGLNYTDRYPLSSGGGFYQLNFNEAVNANDELIWGFPQPAVYDSNKEFYVTIPSTQVFTSVIVRLSNSQGTCGSDDNEDDTDFSVTEIRLPPNQLLIDVNNIVNTKQCLPSKVSFKLNVSHLNILQTYRAPYTLKYQIANESGNYSGVITHPTLITQNQQLVTLTVPQFFGNNPALARLKITLTDIVDCESTLLTLDPIPLPTQALGLSNSNNWTITYVSGTAGSPNAIYNKAYQIVGGIAPYTTPAGEPLLATSNSTSASTNVALNNGLTITIQDSVGCLITRNSG